MKNEDSIGIALVKELCPICCKELDGPIILNSILTKKAANDVKSMHGKVIGFAEKPCPECQKLIDEGCFFIIGIDIEKSEPNNPYRTGHIVGLKKDCEFVQNILGEYLKHDFCMMDYKDMIKFKMINE